MNSNSVFMKALASLMIGVALLFATLVAPLEVKAQDTGWQGEYFNNPYLWGTPVFVRQDSAVNFDWGLGSPDSRIPADGFSVRWTRTLFFDGGRYRFLTETDDGVRLYVNGIKLIDKWQDQSPTIHSAEIDLGRGNHTIVMDYYENRGGAVARLWWQWLTPGQPNPPTPLPPAAGEWRGDYFNNRYLAGSPALVRNDRQIAFNWGVGSPDARIPADGFSVRWTQDVTFEAGRYRFTTYTDDGVRLFVNGKPIIQQWKDQAPTTYTADVDLTAGKHQVMMEYYENTGGAVAYLWWERLATAPAPPITEWRAEYFNNRWLQGPPALVRNEREIRFDWGAGSPDPKIQSDNFSARWTRTVRFAEGRYEFTTRTDDGVRLWINDRLVIDQWREMARTTFTHRIWLSAGEHTIRMEYYEAFGSASAELSWKGPLEVPTAGNLITCVGPRDSWIKVYQRTAEGGWLDMNPNGWGAIDVTGYLKIDALPVDYLRYGANGHPYRVELWSQGRLVRQVGNIDAGQPAFLIRPGADNFTPWGCPAL